MCLCTCNNEASWQRGARGRGRRLTRVRKGSGRLTEHLTDWLTYWTCAHYTLVRPLNGVKENEIKRIVSDIYHQTRNNRTKSEPQGGLLHFLFFFFLSILFYSILIHHWLHRLVWGNLEETRRSGHGWKVVSATSVSPVNRNLDAFLTLPSQLQYLVARGRATSGTLVRTHTYTYVNDGNICTFPCSHNENNNPTPGETLKRSTPPPSIPVSIPTPNTPRLFPN